MPTYLNVTISLVNDNLPILLLGNGAVDYGTRFFELQYYLTEGGPVRLSANLTITDQDSGEHNISEAQIRFGPNGK